MAALNTTIAPRTSRKGAQTATPDVGGPAPRSYLADSRGAAAWHAANSDFREINDQAAEALADLKGGDLEKVRHLLEAIADRSDSAGDEADSLSLASFGMRH